MLSLVLALAAAPPALSPDQTRNIRCVALLAIVAGEQERRTAAALELPPLGRSGARFAQVVGEQVVETGRTQEQVRELIVAQVAAIQRGAGPDAKLPVEEARGCVDVMNTVAPPPPPPGAVQCAGALKLVADDSRRRGGMSDETKTVMTLAAALDNRARAELRAAGKSESESDRDLVLAREAIAKAPQSAPDIEACVELAKP